jgi:hypothetical protein
VAELNGGPAELGPVTATLACGDARTQISLTGNQWHSLRLKLPPLAAEAEVTLRIEVDRLRSPKRAGINGDLRELGVLVRKAGLE